MSLADDRKDTLIGDQSMRALKSLVEQRAFAKKFYVLFG